MSVREVIYKYRNRPFTYGDADCCAFVGECLTASGGDNPMRLFAYRDEDEAREVIAQYGSLEAAITATLGDPFPIIDAKENDVVLVEQYGEQIAGIVHRTDLGLRCVMRTRKGVVDWPLVRGIRAWRPHGRHC